MPCTIKPSRDSALVARCNSSTCFAKDNACLESGALPSARLVASATASMRLSMSWRSVPAAAFLGFAKAVLPVAVTSKLI